MALIAAPAPQRSQRRPAALQLDPAGHEAAIGLPVRVA
jgi:hypothetical protein